MNDKTNGPLTSQFDGLKREKNERKKKINRQMSSEIKF